MVMVYIKISYLTPQSRVCEEATSSSATEEKSLHFMEPKVSIPSSQEPTSKIIPFYAISPYFFKTHFNIIVPTMPRSS